VLSPQGVPQTGQQGVITGVGKIAIAQGKRSGFAPCASANQQGLPAPTGFKYQSDFGGRLVRAIHDKVGVGRNHLLHAFWRDEIIDAVHTTSRIDVSDTLCHRHDFGLAKCAAQSVNLTVDIRFRNVIKVDQGDVAHAATGQRLCAPGAYAPNTGHNHVALLQARGAAITIQAIQATKATLRIHEISVIHRAWILAALQ